MSNRIKASWVALKTKGRSGLNLPAVSAYTKSEARALEKKQRKIPRKGRLPVGVTMRAVGCTCFHSDMKPCATCRKNRGY
jgi:hypothetical protein